MDWWIGFDGMWNRMDRCYKYDGWFWSLLVGHAQVGRMMSSSPPPIIKRTHTTYYFYLTTYTSRPSLCSAAYRREDENEGNGRGCLRQCVVVHTGPKRLSSNSSFRREWGGRKGRGEREREREQMLALTVLYFRTGTNSTFWPIVEGYQHHHSSTMTKQQHHHAKSKGPSGRHHLYNWNDFQGIN